SYTQTEVVGMRVTHIKLETFMVKVARTREQEAASNDAAKHSARLVEPLMQGNVQDSELLDLLHHVLMCLPCSQEFQVLQDCARMDAEDSWPSFDDMWNKIERGK